MYDLLSGLSVYLQHEKGFDEKLMSDAFKEIHNTLDNVMKERAMKSVGVNEVECEFVSHEHEEILWQRKMLGKSNPDELHCIVFFLIGTGFGLHGCNKHHDVH